MLQSSSPAVHRKLRSRARKGIPSAIRGQAWAFLVASQHAPGANAASLENACNDDALHAIVLDLARTFPGHALFGNADGQEALKRILVRYASFDPVLGYCQGMSFIAGMLLTFCTPQQAFDVLAGVMNAPLWSFRSLLCVLSLVQVKLTPQGASVPGMAAVHLRTFQLDRLIAKARPRLYAHLARHDIQTRHFASGWLISGLANAFPFDFVARVWDVFLCEGWGALLAAVVGFLATREPEILTASFESFFTLLRRWPLQIDADAAMRVALDVLDRHASPAALARLEVEHASSSSR